MGVESNEQKQKMGFEQKKWGLSRINKKKMGFEPKKKMGVERMVDQELIEECKKKEGG